MTDEEIAKRESELGLPPGFALRWIRRYEEGALSALTGAAPPLFVHEGEYVRVPMAWPFRRRAPRWWPRRRVQYSVVVVGGPK